MENAKNDTPIFIIGNPRKEGIESVLADLETFVSDKCNLLGATLGADAKAAVDAGAERLIVLGGDGTLIGISRSLGVSQIPLIGVNAGKLGFLAEFTIDELKRNFSACLCDAGMIDRRMVLHVEIQDQDCL
ncbi:MAG: NAD(+)/NADH kinase, partial [Phycisphaerae bacterium]